MPERTPQTYANHRKFVPLYHFVLAGLLLLNFGYAIWGAVKDFGFDRVVALTTAIALILMYLFVRIFATGAQDRVIRLEERLRFGRLLPDDLKPRIEEFTRAQMVGLRFAGDAELPDLARRVLNENIRDGEVIKRMISEWRADYERI
jgi:hypothetical protein